MPFTYSLFESIPAGTSVRLRVEHANELRLAVLERGTAIGFTPPSLPVAVVCQTAKVSWLNAMRTAIEEILAEGKYGRLASGLVDAEVWTPWTRADLLTLVHARFPDCGAGDNWIAVAQYDCVIGEHLREMYYACEVLAYCESLTPSASITASAGNRGYSDISSADCEADYDLFAWDAGMTGLPSICSVGQQDPAYILQRERAALEIQLAEPIDLKELWVANYTYEYVFLEPQAFGDAGFSTPIANRGFLDGTTSFKAYAQLAPAMAMDKNAAVPIS